MRERLLDTLGDLAHTRFLVYLMGPYQTFDIESIVDGTDSLDADSVPESVDFGRLVGSDENVERDEATLDLLLTVRDELRTDPGVNAFLALDVDIPLEEMDAATQSIEFAVASNAVVYIVPKVGDNLGVGIEAGAVLEALFREREDRDGNAKITDHHERVVFVHESGVRSAMIAAVQDRWEARIYSYDDRDDLVRQLRLFVRDIARREQLGDLEQLDDFSG
ncbi:MAG: hypothetical protein V5A45_13475 [Haloarculaceae archaeon]